MVGATPVKTYVAGRLSVFPEPRRNAVVDRVAAASKDNFLHAYHLVNDLLASGAVVGDAELLDLRSARGETEHCSCVVTSKGESGRRPWRAAW